MSSSCPTISNNKTAQRTVRALVGFGFEEARALEAVRSIGDAADVQLAMNWLLDHGEEDNGGAVEFKHCPHVHEIGGFQALVKPVTLPGFGQVCAECKNQGENWHCLLCNVTHCGRYAAKHALEHWQQTRRAEEAILKVVDAAAGKIPRGHCLQLGWSDLSIWCYECESYVQHEMLEPLLKRASALKFGEDNNAAGNGTAGAGPSPSSSSSSISSSGTVKVGDPLQATHAGMHGRLGDDAWEPPRVLRACADEARPGYKTMKAHEYSDTPEVLRAKVRKLAELVRKSANCVAYTGAGISTASGISDYATKAANSGSAAQEKKRSPWAAQPTLAHRVLVGLFRAGHLKHWVQQNHDGLPQKAGFPQQHLNEIHGAWFDPSNPVVPMSGTLRADLIDRMLEWEERADLCLALGTSMVGMNADRMAIAAARRANAGKKGALGTVIVALQQTQYDSHSSLRIFATIDRVMELFADEMGVRVRELMPPAAESSAPTPTENVFTGMPYGTDGQFDPKKRMHLDLRCGAKVRLANQPDWDQERHGNVAEVIEPQDVFANAGHIVLRLGNERTGCLRVLGRWWLEAAQKGEVTSIPVVPLDDQSSSVL